MKRKALPSELSEALLTDILNGMYPPDSAIPSAEVMARTTGLSRLTVREAVNALAAKKVLRVEQGRGTFVNPVREWTPSDPVLLMARASENPGRVPPARRLLEARRIVEVAVAGLAAARRQDSQLRDMREALERMRGGHAVGDVAAFVDADIAFHEAIMAAADNVFIESLFEPIKGAIHLVRAQTSSFHEEREHAIEHHTRILARIKASDRDGAAAAMEAHLRQTAADYATFLEGSSESDSEDPLVR